MWTTKYPDVMTGRTPSECICGIDPRAFVADMATRFKKAMSPDGRGETACAPRLVYSTEREAAFMVRLSHIELELLPTKECANALEGATAFWIAIGLLRAVHGSEFAIGLDLTLEDVAREVIHARSTYSDIQAKGRKPCGKYETTFGYLETCDYPLDAKDSHAHTQIVDNTNYALMDQPKFLLRLFANLKVVVPEAQLADLRERITASPWFTSAGLTAFMKDIFIPASWREEDCHRLAGNIVSATLVWVLKNRVRQRVAQITVHQVLATGEILADIQQAQGNGALRGLCRAAVSVRDTQPLCPPLVFEQAAVDARAAGVYTSLDMNKASAAVAAVRVLTETQVTFLRDELTRTAPVSGDAIAVLRHLDTCLSTYL